MPPREIKARLRQEALARRDALDLAQRRQMSQSATEHAEQNIEFAPGTVISGFFPIRSEIDLRPLLDRLAARGARICLPVIVDRETIVFRELVAGAPMAQGSFGTVWPNEDAQELEPQILLMPLAVFDRQGNRIGYGAGYYDRVIARLRAKGGKPLLIGFGFCVQQIAQIEAEAHDQRLDAIVTEDGFHGFDRKER